MSGQLPIAEVLESLVRVQMRHARRVLQRSDLVQATEPYRNKKSGSAFAPQEKNMSNYHGPVNDPGSNTGASFADHVDELFEQGGEDSEGSAATTPPPAEPASDA